MPKTIFLALIALVAALALAICGAPTPTAAPPAPAPTNSPAPAPAQAPDTPHAFAAAPTDTPVPAKPADQPTIPPPPIMPPTFAPAVQHFRFLSASTEDSPEVTLAIIRGHVWAPNGVPYRGIEVTARSVDQTIKVKTDANGLYIIHLGTVGFYSVFVLQDEGALRQVGVYEHDVVTLDWVSVPLPPSSQARTSLLAEIRSVKMSHLGRTL